MAVQYIIEKLDDKPWRIAVSLDEARRTFGYLGLDNQLVLFLSAMPSCKQAGGFRDGLRFQSWQRKPPTYTAPVTNSPGGRDRTVPQVAGMDTGRLCAWTVHCWLVAVFIILLAGINLTAGDQPLPVALSTCHWALRREGSRGNVPEISSAVQRPPFSTPSLPFCGICRILLSLIYLLIPGYSKLHRTLLILELPWAGISKPFFLWNSQRRKRYLSATKLSLSSPLRLHQKPTKCGREKEPAVDLCASLSEALHSVPCSLWGSGLHIHPPPPVSLPSLATN